MAPLSPRGLLHALLAFTSWGLFPLYWKPFARVSPWETLSHRVGWSFLVLTAAVILLRQSREALAVFRCPRRAGLLALTAVLLSTNWTLFIHAVNTGRVVQASLGYFLTPLINIILAFLCLKESLSRLQVTAVGLAGLGVIHFGWHLGEFPWIAVGIALTFGLYGMFRKVVAVTPLVGLAVETAFMTPVALTAIWLLSRSGAQAFGQAPGLTMLFIGSGIITALPLFWFISAAKLLPLSTMGFLQFLAPTLQLAVGVLVFHEPFTGRQAVSFVLIWSAVALYLATLVRSRRANIVPNPD